MRVVTFGELMLRLQPENYLRFVQSDKLEATFGGAEANVAVSLANFGADACFVTKLPHARDRAKRGKFVEKIRRRYLENRSRRR